MSIEFPLPRKQPPFGPVSDPKIPVALRTLHGHLTLQFLIDTGADFSVAPRRLAELVGLDWDRLAGGQIASVGQGRVAARLGRLPVRIHDRDLAVRCLFVETPRSLLILGRTDFLDQFVLTIDQPRRRITLQAVDV